MYTYNFLHECVAPKLFVSGSRDKYGPPQNIRMVVQQASEPKQLVLVEGGDHFFEGHLQEMQDADSQTGLRTCSRRESQAEAS